MRVLVVREELVEITRGHLRSLDSKCLAMINLDELPMRVGLGQFQELFDERLQFIKQCGCDDFQMNTPIQAAIVVFTRSTIATLRNSSSLAPLERTERTSRLKSIVAVRRSSA